MKRRDEPPARRLSRGERLALAAPYLWLLALFAAPFLIVVKISLSQAALAMPPYTPVFAWTRDPAIWLGELRQLSLDAYAGLFSDPIYLQSYLSSLWIAALATAAALCLAYPVAYAMTRASSRWKPALVLLAMAPFWTSFLIRVYAWIAILKDEGFLNRALLSLGVISKPLSIYATNWAVLIGIVYSYLPFMILPIFNAIDKQDRALLEAAADLGASPRAAFWRVTAPLSLPGVLAGSLLVFIPAVGEFVIPDLLGGSDTLMIGRTMWTEFFENRDWPTAAAVAVLLLLVLLGPLAIYERVQSGQQGEGRS